MRSLTASLLRGRPGLPSLLPLPSPSPAGTPSKRRPRGWLRSVLEPGWGDAPVRPPRGTLLLFALLLLAAALLACRRLLFAAAPDAPVPRPPRSARLLPGRGSVPPPPPATPQEMALWLASPPAGVSALQRQRFVTGMIEWSWSAYAASAMGQDELHPLSQSGSDWVHLGLTAVDGLDTLLLAGLEGPAGQAREWAVAHLAGAMTAEQPEVWVNLFETTIRVLGGLLAASGLTPRAAAAAAVGGGGAAAAAASSPSPPSLPPFGDPPLVALAGDLAARLAVAFDTASGVPLSDVRLATRQARSPAWGDSSVAEAATLALEFAEAAAAAAEEAGEGGQGEAAAAAAAAAGGGAKPLAAAAAAAARAQRAVAATAAPDEAHGLVFAKFVDPSSGGLRGERVATLGARADSYYEYLLKEYLRGGRADGALLDSWQRAEQGITTRLLARAAPPAGGALFCGELFPRAGAEQYALAPKVDHLVCFLPGLLALAALSGVPTLPGAAAAAERAAALARLGLPAAGGAGGGDADGRLALAGELAAGCRQMYLVGGPHHLGPEITHFDGPGGAGTVHQGDGHSLLRPEYVESLFVLWRATGNQTYRDWGWDVAAGVERAARVPTGGYASVADVGAAQPALRDHMESFFLAETLKYLWLLFDDDPDRLRLDEWVFNTEAHPLAIRRAAAAPPPR